jgi:hypothetical protein
MAVTEKTDCQSPPANNSARTEPATKLRGLRSGRISSYKIAKAALLENARIYIDSEADPFRHNLNVAIYQLIEALEADLRELKSDLARIEELQRSLKVDSARSKDGFGEE